MDDFTGIFDKLERQGEKCKEKRPAARSKNLKESIEMMSEECWIGPKVTTALDCMFQPLYIGGALANDKKITLGDLFITNEDDTDEMNLAFVHDFGDWWSHTISVSKFDGSKVPSNASVAHLVSGEGGCPPEDTGGTSKYATTMNRLTGKIRFESGEDGEKAGTYDPSSERWWDLLYGEVRQKLNKPTISSPIDFDLEDTRAKLETAIRGRTQKGGGERDNLVRSDFNTGLVSQAGEKSCSASTEQPKEDPLKFCAVCDVTVALKVCSGCKSVAFCGREHQVQYWPKHKATCKRIQKELKKGKK